MSKNETDIDLAAEVAADPSSEADAPEAEAPVVLTKAEKAARRKADNAAKKIQKDKDKAAATKVKDLQAKSDAKEKQAAKQLTIVQRDAMVLINHGKKAMNQVGTGNLAWTVAAFKLRELTKGTGVNFKDEALEHWGVGKNTATKLANAGELLTDLAENDKEKMAFMPMNNINNLSTIAGFGEKKLELGVDTAVIKMDATEEAINAFNRSFDDNGNPVIVVEAREIPGTEAADAERDEAEVSESETPAKLITRLAEAAKDLTPKQTVKLVCLLTKDLGVKAIEDMFTALEKQHPAPEGTEGGE